VTNSDGSSSLSLLSSSGALSVTSSVADPSSLLGYTSTVSGKDANLTVDGVNLTSASNTVANLIPGVTFQLLAPSSSGEQVQVVIGNDNSGVESTVNQMVSDYNSLIGAVNTQEGRDSSGNSEPLFGSPTLTLLQQQLLGGLNMQSPNGYLDSIKNSSDTLSGSLSVAVGSGTAKTIVIGAVPSAADGGAAANTIYTGSGSDDNTLAGLAAAINAANSELSYSDTGYTSANLDSGTVGSVANGGDSLTGVLSIAVGSGTAQTITLDSSDNTLQGLADTINGTSGMGVTASVVTNSDGTSSLSLVSQTAGTAGALTVNSNLSDGIGVTANVATSSTGSQLVLVSDTAGSGGALAVTSAITDATTSAALNYNSSSSDINSLTSLGISVNNNGSLTFDATSLDSVLNSDYSSVVGFFQNVDSWGQTFSTMLTNAGTSSSTGILSLASSSNSNIESTLNADISKEQSLISAQQVSLTAELNSANEIMQELPSQLQGVNELYSAITGYNQSANG
jgi:flagellar hook-associated protein 2